MGGKRTTHRLGGAAWGLSFRFISAGLGVPPLLLVPPRNLAFLLNAPLPLRYACLARAIAAARNAPGTALAARSAALLVFREPFVRYDDGLQLLLIQ